MKTILAGFMTDSIMIALSGCVYEEPVYYHHPAPPPREVIVAPEPVRFYHPELVVQERVYCGHGGWRRGYCY